MSNLRRTRREVQPRGGNATDRQVRQAIANIKKTIHGERLSPSADPPGYTACPWTPITVPIRYTKTDANSRLLLTVGDLINDVKYQVGLNGLTFNTQLRLTQLLFWTDVDSSAADNSLNVDVYDLLSAQSTDANDRLLTSISDVGGKNHFARTGYTYPQAQASRVLSPSSEGQLVFGADVGAGITLVAYIRCLWRPQPPSAIDVISSVSHSNISGPR